VYSRTCKLEGSQCFQLKISLPKVVGHSTTVPEIPVDLSQLPEEYHNFADVFSKTKASKLAEHRPYDLKITLDEGTTPPFGPIYSLSQEELAALCKFIDKNLATGLYVHPVPHVEPRSSLFRRKTAHFGFVLISKASTEYPRRIVTHSH